MNTILASRNQSYFLIKVLKFHVKDFSDLTFEFIMENGRAVALKQSDPAGEYINKRTGP